MASMKNWGIGTKQNQYADKEYMLIPDWHRHMYQSHISLCLNQAVHVYSGCSVVELNVSVSVDLKMVAMALTRLAQRCRMIQPALVIKSLEVASGVLVGEYQCLVDGSYSMPDKGRAGYVIYLDTTMVQYEAHASSALYAFQMKALALLLALRGAIEREIRVCTFHCDSLQLVNLLVGSEVPVSVDWHAHREVLQAWDILVSHQGFKCVYISREHNLMFSPFWLGTFWFL